VFLHPEKRKKETIKKRQFTKRTLYSVVGLGIVFLSGIKFQTNPTPLFPRSQILHPQQINLLQESNFSKPLNFTFFQLHHNALLPFLVSS